RRRYPGLVSQSLPLPLMKILRLFSQLPAAGGDRAKESEIQQPQFSPQNRDDPFCSGTSFRGITPETVSRTLTVFSLASAALIRISLVAGSNFPEVSAARKFPK